MKKFILLLVTALSFTIAADAYTLFPHFVDIAGDFEDGTPDKFYQLDIATNHWRVSPSFFNSIKSADDFLKNTLPYSSYDITRQARTLDDDTQIIIYTTSLAADGLYEDKWSVLYLVQTPGEPLYVGIAEDPVN